MSVSVANVNCLFPSSPESSSVPSSTPLLFPFLSLDELNKNQEEKAGKKEILFILFFCQRMRSLPHDSRVCRPDFSLRLVFFFFWFPCFPPLFVSIFLSFKKSGVFFILLSLHNHRRVWSSDSLLALSAHSPSHCSL